MPICEEHISLLLVSQSPSDFSVGNLRIYLTEKSAV